MPGSVVQGAGEKGECRSLLPRGMHMLSDAGVGPGTRPRTMSATRRHGRSGHLRGDP